MISASLVRLSYIPFQLHPYFHQVAGPFNSNNTIRCVDKLLDPIGAKDQLKRIKHVWRLSLRGRLEEAHRRMLILEQKEKDRPFSIVSEYTTFFDPPYTPKAVIPARLIPISPTQRRSFSTSARMDTTIRTNQLVHTAKPIVATSEIDLGSIMKDLQDLQLLDLWEGNKVGKSGSGYKDAERHLWKLFHAVDEDEKVKVTFAQLQECLPPIYSLAWTAIAERLINRRVKRLDNATTTDKAAIDFLRIHAVGPKYAQKFIDSGAKTLADLPEKVTLTRSQLIGHWLSSLQGTFVDINRLIPRSEMKLLKSALDSSISTIKPAKLKLDSEILGSFRRGVEFSSDIDLVIRCKGFDDATDLVKANEIMSKVIAKLTLDGLITPENQLSLSPKKFSGLMKLPGAKHYRRIDIRLSPWSSYYYCLLGGSGDALLQKLLRLTAKQRGLTLNEYGMGSSWTKADQNPNGFRPDSSRLVKDEAAIFEILGLPYLKPEERDYQIWRQIYLDAGVDMKVVDKL